jgi:actin-related protein
VVGNGIINSSIYAPQYWRKGKEADASVTEPPLISTLSGQSNTTIFLFKRYVFPSTHQLSSS